MNHNANRVILDRIMEETSERGSSAADHMETASLMSDRADSIV